jgi:ribosomal protein S18 acetylase RimI-like enzyme
MTSATVEPARPEDVPRVLELMRDLAEIEGNSARFSATAATLRTALFETAAGMLCWVARDEGRVVGIALCAPSWTGITCRPSLRLVALFVDATTRKRGIGEQLVAAVAERCVELDCALDLTVRAGNATAQRFYRRLGGTRRDGWEPWRLPVESLRRLAGATVDVTSPPVPLAPRRPPGESP